MALEWLRTRLMPRGADAMLLAAYAMVLAGLSSFVLNQRDLPPGRFALGILALVVMFMLHMVQIDLEQHLGPARAGRLHLVLCGALWLLVTGLALESAGFSFVPFLLFMLVAQAIVILPARGAALYSLLLLGGFVALLGLRNFTLGEIAANLVSLSSGLIFVIVFSAVLNLYRRQTERAEALLARLTEAHAELEAARRRDHELAVAEERVRLARDIHDGLGHHLAALNVQLQAAARLIERDPARAAAAIATSREVAQAALDEVRQSVAAMRSHPLDGRRLPEAVTALADTFGRRAEIHTSVALSGEPADLAPAAAQTLYRAAQEGLTNAQKHGAARAVQIALAYTPDVVSLTITDDGTATGGTGAGFGLAGLRERAEQLGGHLTAASLAEGGYMLTVTIPTRMRQGQP